MFVVYYGTQMWVWGERTCETLDHLRDDWRVPGITGCLWLVPGTFEPI